MVERCVLSDEELIAYGTSAPSPVHSLFWDTLAGLLKTTFPRFPCNWLPLEVGLLTGASGGRLVLGVGEEAFFCPCPAGANV